MTIHQGHGEGALSSMAVGTLRFSGGLCGKTRWKEESHTESQKVSTSLFYFYEVVNSTWQINVQLILFDVERTRGTSW